MKHRRAQILKNPFFPKTACNGLHWFAKACNALSQPDLNRRQAEESGSIRWDAERGDRDGRAPFMSKNVYHVITPA
jgi:hypothetical protein